MELEDQSEAGTEAPGDRWHGRCIFFKKRFSSFFFLSSFLFSLKKKKKQNMLKVFWEANSFFKALGYLFKDTA